MEWASRNVCVKIAVSLLLNSDQTCGGALCLHAQISFIFLNNNASVGSSVYMTNIGSCLSSDGYDETVQLFSLNFAHYQ